MTAYEDLFFQVEMLILFIFVMDLGVLYGKSKDYKDFFKSNWFDIIATIPFGQIFRLAKLLRIVKLIKSFKIFSKTTKVIHVEKMVKIFSKKEVVEDMMEEDNK
jgi:voltage-gated potassium channel